MYALIDQYINHLKRNRSEHTVRNYEIQITKFADWAFDKVNEIEELSNQELYLDYLDELKFSGKASKTINTYMSSIFSFAVYLHRKGIIQKTPFVNSNEMNDYLPVIKKKKVTALTENQVESMIFLKSSPLVDAIIRTFYDSAMRVSELVNAKWSDMEFGIDGSALLTVSGKGRGGMSKVRIVKLTPSTVESLRNYANSLSFESDFLFVSKLTKKPFTTRRISQLIKERANECNIDKSNTHVFRKTLATILLEKGMQIEYLAEYLGHSNISTTKTYTDTERQLIGKFDQFHKSL